MNDTCGSCGLAFRPEPGYYVGAMYVNYLTTAAVGLAAGLTLLDRVPLPALLVALAAFGLVFPVVFFRYSRSLWLALDQYIHSVVGDR